MVGLLNCTYRYNIKNLIYDFFFAWSNSVSNFSPYILQIFGIYTTSVQAVLAHVWQSVISAEICIPRYVVVGISSFNLSVKN